MSFILKPFVDTGQTDFTTDLIASWQFEGDFLDYTGNHDATKTGTVTNNTSGKVGNQADFQGSGDYLTVTDHADFSFTDGNDLPFSIAFWVNFDAFSQIQMLLWKGGGPTDREWRIQTNGVGTGFRIRLFEASSGEYININTTSSLSIATWYHVVCTYDGSETKEGLTLYVDKTSVGIQSDSGAYAGMTDSIIDLTLGSRTDLPDTYELNGKMDEIKIWKNRELTSAEVIELYDLENAGTSVLP